MKLQRNRSQSPSVLSSPEDTKLYFSRVIKPMDLGLVEYQKNFQVRRTSGSLGQGEIALLSGYMVGSCTAAECPEGDSVC